MMVIAKFNDKWVHIVKFSRDVKFSDEKNWFMINFDFEKSFRKREQFKWVPASTRFGAVKEIIGE
jgi:hypothetical protein